MANAGLPVWHGGIGTFLTARPDKRFRMTKEECKLALERGITVRLDGIIIPWPIECDTESGYVDVHTIHCGQIERDPLNSDNWHVQRLFGVVTIHRKGSK